MAERMKFMRLAMEASKAAVSASLCAVMAVAPALAEAPATKTPAAPKLTKQQKTLHALNRFTFGPRPGDVEAAEKMGLHAWFERQLNPQSIDDSALNTMLLKFPAMQLSQDALLQKFPSPQVLRQMSRQHTPLPTDPAEHAIYAHAIVNYEKQIAAAELPPEAKAGKTFGAMNAPTAPAGGQAIATDMAGTEVSKNAKGKERIAKVPYTGEAPSTIIALPPNERMAKILAMPPEQLNAFRAELLPHQTAQMMAGLSPEQVEVMAALQGPVRVVGAEALETRLLRDVYSDRQLEAVMTDFWLNHFSVYVRKNQNEPYLLPSYERDTIRPNALGKFEDLLVATAESPAMLMYLDNFQSIGPDSPAAQRGRRFGKAAPNSQVAQAMPKGINENYARELMELHTIGVRCEVSADHTAKQLDRSCGSGYTQADVTNVAKVLTGWTIDKPYRGGGGFTFEENRHEGGSKQVLGQTIKEGGQKEGLEVLHMLATSPATAAFISHKLAVRFVSDDPPKALEDRMAKTFLASGGDIKSVLRTMFNAPEFWSPLVYRAKVKTPIEFLASALRASDATVANALPLVQAMDRLGMPLYGMQTPNGYPWVSEPWVSTTALVSRMNFALAMSGGLLPGTHADWAKLLGETATESATMPSPETEHQLEMLLLGQPAAEQTRAVVLEQGAKPGQVQEARKNFALATANGDDMMAVGGKGKGKRAFAGGGASMSDLAAKTGNDSPVTTMAGLLLGSPDFQRR
ncbi:MAG: DUF1800 domain-containing protein [Acidobacteriaceae bacterium]